MPRTAPAALVLLTLFGARPAAAAWPPPPDKELTQQDLSDPAQQPDDPWFRWAWHLWGFTPATALENPSFRAEEIPLGSGMNADRAWQLSVGRRATALAVTDSGFRWNNADLADKWRLNRGELPAPRDAQGHECVTCADPFDRNGDGAFTVSDFTTCAPKAAPRPECAADPRLTGRLDRGDVNRNGLLDPQDFIAVFADGKDDDLNGYPDDICGWDFLWDDPDPEDDTLTGGSGYSHGDFTAATAAAEGGNGTAGIGVCPSCTLIPIRVSDSFVVEGNRFAQGVLYALAAGADVVFEALASRGQPPLVQHALDEAYRRGVPVIAASADEGSFHHNAPGNSERTLYVRAVRHDGPSATSPETTTFLNANNCSNWGGHLAVAAPAANCSSEATALIGGLAGLLVSYAAERGLPALSAQEVYALIEATADDVDVPESATDSTKWPSQPGWEAHFGFGRVNARRALEAVRDGLIPPSIDVTAPRWFETLAPSAQAAAISGTITAPRAQSLEWSVSIATGLSPREEDFRELARGTAPRPADGVLASFVPGELFADATAAPLDPHQFAVSIRVRAAAGYPSGEARAESRKTFFVHRDPMLRPGFPLFLGASGESSPHLVDLDGDCLDEIVLATADGLVHAFRADGGEAPGFPVSVHALAEREGSMVPSGVRASIEATVAVGDLDGDGASEVVAATTDGALWAWSGRGGAAVTGFPVRVGDAGLACFAPSVTGCRPAGWVSRDFGGKRGWELRELERGFFASPVLYDLDADGRLEIVQAGLDGMLHVFRYDGTPQPGFPIEVRDPEGGAHDAQGTPIRIRGRIIGTPAVGDADGDGRPEILVGTNEVYENGTGARAYLISGAGAPSPERGPEAFLPGWPVRLAGFLTNALPFLGRGVPASPLMIDADRDGAVDLLGIQTLSAQAELYGPDGRLLIRGSAGSFGDRSNSSDEPAYTAVNSPMAADLDGDRLPELFDGLVGFMAADGVLGGKRVKFDHSVGGWTVGKRFKLDRDQLAANPAHVAVADYLRAFPQVVDDYQFLTSYAAADVDGDGRREVIGGSGGYTLHAFNAQGERPAGWPKFTGGWILASPALGDLDRDGLLDVVAMTREGWLFAWSTTGKASQALEWESFHHDARNTGNDQTPIPRRCDPLPPDEEEPPKSCGCATTPAGPAALLAASVLTLVRRRRRGNRQPTREGV